MRLLLIALTLIFAPTAHAEVFKCSKSVPGLDAPKVVHQKTPCTEVAPVVVDIKKRSEEQMLL
jgi:hypothetical protein